VHAEKVISLADDKFQVLTAVVKTLYACLSLGVLGATTVEACCFPKPIIQIYEKFTEGDKEGALKLQAKLNRFLEQYPKGASIDNYLRTAEVKYLISKKGICQEYMTGYYRELTCSEKNQIDHFLCDNSFIFD
jgi:dihydrodipicolinate synthase/N-acetylneuraminate lyase